MKRYWYAGLILLSLVVRIQAAVATDTREQSGDSKALVATVIAAYGGEKAVEGMKSVYAIGDINAFMRQDQGKYELSFKRPRKLRVDTRYQRSNETRILNGDNGYRGTNETPLSPVKDHRYLAMVYQYKHFDVLYGFIHDYYAITRKGKEVYNGKIAEVLHLTDQEGPPMDVFVDSETRYIVKVTGYFTVADGRVTTLSSEFSDFKKAADTVFPYKITNHAGGQKIAETSMRTYTINPALSDAVFAP